MSNTPQQPADGWQPSQQQQPPVYRPQEQPPTEEPPPWSPESQRMSPMSQQVPVEDVDGTVKYVGAPGAPSPQYGPPPGVPVSPFDAPPQPHPGMPAAPFDAPQQYPAMPASDPFGGGGGMPVSGMPVSGMPPVSSIPASGMPVSGMPGQPPYGQPPYGQPPYGGGQFSPQGGQLVPVSGGGAQPWGAPDAIQRKKKSGKGPMWLLLVGIVVIAAALGVGGFILFKPDSGDPNGQETGTISAAESEAEPVPDAEPVLVAGGGGLKFVASGLAATWADSTEAPAVLGEAAGKAAEDGSGSAFVGVLDIEALGVAADTALGDVGTAVDASLAESLGAISGEVASESYWVDGRQSQFRTFTAGETTVIVAIVQVDGGFEAFIGTAQGDAAETVEAARLSVRFGDL